MPLDDLPSDQLDILFQKTAEQANFDVVSTGLCKIAALLRKSIASGEFEDGFLSQVAEILDEQAIIYHQSVTNCAEAMESIEMLKVQNDRLYEAVKEIGDINTRLASRLSSKK